MLPPVELPLIMLPGKRCLTWARRARRGLAHRRAAMSRSHCAMPPRSRSARR